MYYEESVIDGRLFARTAPDGEWHLASSSHANAVNELLRLTDEQRLAAFGFFCRSCGAADPRCQCWNDE